MKRIIVHWTAGGHKASEFEKEHYHFLVEDDGKTVPGRWPVDANEKPLKGKYAAHTLNANTGSIGVSLCCMRGATETPFSSGPSPMTKVQWDSMIHLVATLCREHKISVTPQTVLTHAEVSKNLGIPQKGKWDITRLSFDNSTVGAEAVGNRLRKEVLNWVNPKPKIVEPPVLADFHDVLEEETSMFDNVKSLFKSKTLLGIAVMAAPTIANLFGANLSSADATAVVNTAAEWGTTTVEAAGALLAVWGRMTANSRLVLKK